MDSIPEKSPVSAETPASEKPKRRVRYSGKNPRAFHEKYKELNPEKFPETIQKVLAAGKTPAGMHRPIMLTEILGFLEPQAGQIAVDCTLGYGGHAIEIIKRIMPGGKFIGIDADPIELPRTEKRLRDLGCPSESIVTAHSNFAGLPKVLAQAGVEAVDLVLADLGISSMQLDTPERGFSYKLPGPLDLRLNPNKGRSAAEWLSKVDQADLVEALKENGDEPHAELIAETIINARRSKPIATTTQLTQLLFQTINRLPQQVREREGDAPIRRTFQAIRIAVNDEFAALEHFLRVVPLVLKPGGKLAVLTFHSGEDRRVKKSFESLLAQGVYRQVTEEVMRASQDERRDNPRSTSAKFRWAIKA
ncbi:MAG: 16S rRNA (cytosine(1402)-N(4))-methyltransferase RsmH [Verrucomicrobiales bacterium]